MANVTYRVVVPFMLDADGIVVPGEAKAAPNGEHARRRASSMATTAGNVGAIAFSRTGDPDNGGFSKGVMLASFGEVDLEALAGSEAGSMFTRAIVRLTCLLRGQVRHDLAVMSERHRARVRHFPPDLKTPEGTPSPARQAPTAVP